MLGNPKWFKKRKYSGWGLTPITWQGWVYVGALVFAFFFISAVTVWLNIQAIYQVGVVLLMLAAIVLDTVDISARINSDEREIAHEALSERNAAWTMVVVLIGGIIFQAIISALQGQLYVDPFIIAALLGGVIAKGISSWYYIDK
ncbi:MAG TPA: hypothetical protein VLE95_03125 [Chlamydiales bacterium]|nr:hypothetical protein [Chlamydiales bacterium]